ncbi:hypothetical protein F1737_11555 [Methanoplanus sp. FWC-SCC4]|uniref:Uncharacterized protein n=2 Tax=Methanochimaera problematica TaxID=2609417 RepID=A0AA97FEV4_9EURY|nr:hypothetical protein F1737_11555 [Methanoplanus sp. FWC-SCC4]
MTNVEGFIFIVIFMGVVACLIGAVVLAITYAVLKRIKNPVLRTGIIILVLIFGFLRLMPLDAPTLLTAALMFTVPVAVLVPPFILPGLFKGRFSGRFSGSSQQIADNEPRFSRLLLCHIIVSAAGFFLPFILVKSGLSMMPEIYWHTPLSNGIVYAGAFILDVALAGIFFRIVGWGEDESGEKVEQGKNSSMKP